MRGRYPEARLRVLHGVFTQLQCSIALDAVPVTPPLVGFRVLSQCLHNFSDHLGYDRGLIARIEMAPYSLTRVSQVVFVLWGHESSDRARLSWRQTGYLVVHQGELIALDDVAGWIESEADSGRTVHTLDEWTEHYAVRLERSPRSRS